MNLRAIQVEADEHSESRLGFPFRWSAHHVKEIFLSHLPRDFSLDGSAQVTLICGPRENPSDPVYRQVLGTTCLFVEEFDFAAYKLARPQERQNIILDLLVRSFARIGSDRGVDLRVIHDSAQKVRDENFHLEMATRLSRWAPDRKRHFSVVRKLSFDLGEAWAVEIVDKSGKILNTLWITDRPNYLDQTDRFRKSSWEGKLLVIRDRLGNTEISLDPDAKTVEVWGSLLDQSAIGRRYDEVAIDLRRRTERAITKSRHAYDAGDYRAVVALLAPYSDYLPPKQLHRLEEARRLSRGA